MPQTLIHRKLIVSGLLVASLALTAVSVLGHVASELLGRGNLFGLRPLFHMGLEANVPTWFASILLGFCAIIFLMVGLTRDGESEPRGHWFALSLLFIYLSADEVASIHESVNQNVRRALGLAPDQMRWDAWNTALLIAVGILLGGSLIRLIRGPSGPWFVLAGILYVGGAVGIEAVGNHIFPGLYRDPGLLGLLIADAEELAELLGLVALVEGLGRLLTGRQLVLGFGPARGERAEIGARSMQSVR